LIVLVFEATLPMIEANRAAALRAAVFKVVPGATALQQLVLRDGRLVVAGADETGAGEKGAAEGAGEKGARGTGAGEEGAAIYAAYDASGKFAGYAIPGAGSGFQDTIRLIYGYAPQSGQVIGMDILESKETPGLGDKIYKDPAFVQNFAALAVSPEVVVVKHGTRSAAHEVDGITGATISSKAVVKIINTANRAWLDKLPAPGGEPALRPMLKEAPR
jgi:electron transport complex protein RnfG